MTGSRALSSRLVRQWESHLLSGDWLIAGDRETVPRACCHPHPRSQHARRGPTFKVSSMDRNFLWSPISMALLMSGSSVFTASSMGTGATFSPPAVMISSGGEAGPS